MDRNTLLLGDATRDSRIIEIGPSHAPIAAKRAGWNSFVVDHADQAELRAKYTGYPVDLDAIEVVDAVWRGGRLDHAVPASHHGRFDRLIASHVIEHIPDFVTFMVAAQSLITPSGALALAVPDKRYCFDVLKPISTTGDILAGYNPEGAGRHFRRTLFNQIAYSVGLDGAIAWGQHPVAKATFMNSLTDAFELTNRLSEAPDSAYVDAHAWQFTPAAFRLAILELADGGLIDWHVAECTPAIGSEFIVTLRRGRPVWATPAEREARRLELLLALMVEQREMIDLAALGGLIHIPAQPADPAIARALHEVRDLIGAQQARLDIIAFAIAPPSDAPAALGTLADITARLDAQQRQLASITAQDGTQASIMGSLEAIGASLANHQHQLASLTAADGTQASIMGSLSDIAIRQQHQHQAINDATSQTINALRALETLARQLDDQQRQIAAQQRTLDEVHKVSQRLHRMIRPFLRLRARLLGRPYVD